MHITTYRCDVCGKEIVPGGGLYKIPAYVLEKDGRYSELPEPMEVCPDHYVERAKRILRVLASNGSVNGYIDGQLMRTMSTYILKEMNDRIPELMKDAIEEKAPEEEMPSDDNRRPFFFYGYSDDTVIAQWEHGYSDVGAYDRTAVGTITAPDGTKVCIVGRYAPGNVAGAWAFGIMQVEDDEGEVQPLPEWLHPDSIYFETNSDPDYSVRMFVWAPSGSTFRWEGGQ
jgi:hypothetical protein